METIRRYNDLDKEFVFQTKKNAYIEYIEKYFGVWDEYKQRDYFNEYINRTSDNTFIIECDKKRIGFYNTLVADNGDYIIGNICIIPEYQRKGIGTRILKGIIEEHKNDNIYIQYFKSNPVGALYEKLGFIPSGESEFHYQMVKLKEREHIK